MGHRADFLVARVVGHGPENLTKRDPSEIIEARPRYHTNLLGRPCDPQQRLSALCIDQNSTASSVTSTRTSLSFRSSARARGTLTSVRVFARSPTSSPYSPRIAGSCRPPIHGPAAPTPSRAGRVPVRPIAVFQQGQGTTAGRRSRWRRSDWRPSMNARVPASSKVPCSQASRLRPLP